MRVHIVLLLAPLGGCCCAPFSGVFEPEPPVGVDAVAPLEPTPAAWAEGPSAVVIPPPASVQWPPSPPPTPPPHPVCPVEANALCAAVIDGTSASVLIDTIAAGADPNCPCTYTYSQRKLGSYIPIVQDFLKEQSREFTEHQTPLFIAVHLHKLELAETLLRHRAHPDVPGPGGQVPLDEALNGPDDVDAVRLLVANGATLRGVDLGDVDSVDVARELISRDGDPRSLDVGCVQDPADVGWLLSMHPDLTDEDAEKVVELPPDVVGRLLDAGMPLSIKGTTWDRPLLHEAINSNEALVPLLLDHGASPDTLLSGAAGADTPLCAAAALGRDASVKLLLARGARVDSRCSWGHTALYEAAMSGSSTSTQLLVDAGANVNCTDGDEPLLKALIDRVTFFDPENQLFHGDDQIGAAAILVKHGATFRSGGLNACAYVNARPSSAELKAAVCGG